LRPGSNDQLVAEARMFTGIVTDLGTLAARDGRRFSIACAYDAATLIPGASIACDGCCLTIVQARSSNSGTTFDVNLSNETLARTTLGEWNVGRRINLERPIALGTELGGPLVTGHVDGLATIIGRVEDGDSVRFKLKSPDNLVRYIASK